jgi:hypothetical protein
MTLINKLVSISKKSFIVFVALATSSAYAEYYIVSESAPVTVVCGACAKAHPPKKHKKVVRHYKKHHYKKVHHRPRNCYQVSTYYTCTNYPGWSCGNPCGGTVVTCASSFGNCYDSNYIATPYPAETVIYDTDVNDYSFDRATADDTGAELQIN